MSKKLLLLLFISFYFLTAENINAQPHQGFEFIKKGLIIEASVDSQKIKNYQLKYESLLEDVKQNIDTTDNLHQQNKDLFKYLHKNYLLKYEESKKLSEIFDKQFYNCATASFLYYSIGKELGYKIRIYAPPGHVYLKTTDRKKVIIIDLTDPVDGLSVEELPDQDDVIESLLESKSITKEELSRRGIDSIYQEYIDEDPELTEDNLVQILRFNYASELYKDKKYDAVVKEASEALFIDPKYKGAQESFVLLWGLVLIKYTSTLSWDKIEEIVVEGLKFPELKSEYKKALVTMTAELIEHYVQSEKSIIKIDSLYERCKKVLGKEEYFEEQISSAIISASIYKIEGLFEKGFIDKAYYKSLDLYRSNKDDGNVRSLFQNVAQNFIIYNVRNESFDEALSVADSLLNDFKDYVSIQEKYVYALSEAVFSYNSKHKNPGEDFLKAEKLLSECPNSTNALCLLYHMYAMYFIREQDNSQARIIVEKGLKYDSNNKPLLSDLELINDTMKLPKVNKPKVVKKK